MQELRTTCAGVWCERAWSPQRARGGRQTCTCAPVCASWEGFTATHTFTTAVAKELVDVAAGAYAGRMLARRAPSPALSACTPCVVRKQSQEPWLLEAAAWKYGF